MKEIYEIVRVAKLKQGIQSDRGFALANGINPQVIVDLKSGKSMPNAENMLKILSAAKLDVNDGIKAIERQKEAGFADIGLMVAMSVGATGAMSLAGVSPLSGTAIGAGITGLTLLSIHYAKC